MLYDTTFDRQVVGRLGYWKQGICSKWPNLRIFLSRYMHRMRELVSDAVVITHNMF